MELLLRQLLNIHHFTCPPGHPKIDEGEIAPALKMKVLILLLSNREQIAEAQHHGEKCAKPRIIELMESQACNVECKSPGREFSSAPTKPRLVDGIDKVYLCFQLTAKLDLGKNGLLALLRAERALEIGQGQCHQS